MVTINYLSLATNIYYIYILQIMEGFPGRMGDILTFFYWGNIASSGQFFNFSPSQWSVGSGRASLVLDENVSRSSHCGVCKVVRLEGGRYWRDTREITLWRLSPTFCPLTVTTPPSLRQLERKYQISTLLITQTKICHQNTFRPNVSFLVM